MVEVDRGEGRGAVKLYVHCLIHKFISIASFKEGVKEYFYFMFFNRPQLLTINKRMRAAGTSLHEREIHPYIGRFQSV